MQIKSFLPFALIGAAVAVPAPIPDDVDAEALALVRRQYPVRACSHDTGGIHVIAAGGANTNNQKDYGLLGSLAGKILSAIPGSTNVSVPYDKVLVNNKLQPDAIPGGMKTLKAYTWHYHTSCPTTKMALIGYSSGAVIVMNDLCYGGNGEGTPQINPKLAGHVIVGSVVYGDETRAAGAKGYNKGSCHGYGGTHPRANYNACYPFGDHLQSYCDSGDPDCCVGSPNPNTQIHFGYPKKYDDEATKWIVRRVQLEGGP